MQLAVINGFFRCGFFRFFFILLSSHFLVSILTTSFLSHISFLVSKSSTNNTQATMNAFPKQDIKLNLEEPWLTPESFLPVVTHNVLIKTKSGGHKTTSKVAFYFPIADINDYLNKKFTVELNENGQVIIFKGPHAATYMWAQAAHLLVRCAGDDATEAEMISHLQLAHQLEDGERKKIYKELHLCLPEDYSVNNNLFNDGARGLEVILDIEQITTKVMVNGETLAEQIHAFGKFAVSVDGSERDLGMGKKNEGNSEQAKVRNMLGKSKKGTKKKH